LRVSEKSMLVRINGSKREDVTCGWSKMHNKFHSLYSSQNLIRLIIK
jgi:hypothetical protein